MAMYKVVVKQENVFYISDKIVGNDEAAIKEIAEEMFRDLSPTIEVKRILPCQIGKCPYDTSVSCYACALHEVE